MITAPMTMPVWHTPYGPKAPGRARPADDFYPTPDELCTAVVQDVLCGTYIHRVLDPGCGTGPWGRAVRAVYPDSQILGVELTARRANIAQNTGLLGAYDLVRRADFLNMRFGGLRFDLIIGNPPYQQAEEFVMRSLELLAPGGRLLFLLRTAFVESQGRYKRMFAGQARPAAIYSLVERPSFTGNGRTDMTAYSIFYWTHPYHGPTSFRWLSWRDRDVPRQQVLL